MKGGGRTGDATRSLVEGLDGGGSAKIKFTENLDVILCCSQRATRHTWQRPIYTLAAPLNSPFLRSFLYTHEHTLKHASALVRHGKAHIADHHDSHEERASSYDNTKS